MDDNPPGPTHFAGMDSAYAPERLQLIGEINTDWNLCEQMMQFVVWGLAGLDVELGECITTDLPNLSLLTLCKNLLGRFHADSEHTPFFLAVCNLFDECRQARNAASHGLVMADETDFIVYSLSMKSGRGKQIIKPGPQTNEELEVTAGAIGHLLECFHDCMNHLHDEPSPSRDKRLLPMYTELLRELRQARQGRDLPLPSSSA